MRFSQRIGKKPVKTELQFDSMDNELRIALWNVFDICFLEKVNSKDICYSNFSVFFKYLWVHFFNYPLDRLDDNFYTTRAKIREWFFEWEWYEVYDFIEFVSQVDSPVDIKEFRKFCNIVLERQVSGYRFVDDKIVPITNENELKEIEEAIEKSQKTKLSGANSHLKSALSKLSDRKNPDYRNSVKEAISAVESISKIISGKPKAELAEALKIIEQKVGLHGALKKGFIAIYGYTSNEGGVRHAMLEESKVDFEDAKYMLVSCSAFINYLIMKATKAGIKF